MNIEETRINEQPKHFNNRDSLSLGRTSFHFELSKLSYFRTLLMGIATIMIIICHAEASGVFMPRYLAAIFNFGNYGVDIFLFLSGLGCFYSLYKSEMGGVISSHIIKEGYLGCYQHI